MYVWLHWVFTAVHRLSSSCGEQGLLSSCGVRASHCGGFSWEWALGQVAKVSCSSWDLEYNLNCCGSGA